MLATPSPRKEECKSSLSAPQQEGKGLTQNRPPKQRSLAANNNGPAHAVVWLREPGEPTDVAAA